MAGRRSAGFIAVLGLLAVIAPQPAAPAATVRDYDLGVVEIPDDGPKGPLPVRLWGALGVPSGPGPHPLVIVAHGRHGDNCPDAPGGGPFDFVWPCWGREQRNDLGMRHIVAALASRGVAAIAPDLNAAYTIGWGPDDDRRRWPRVLNRTIAELTQSVAAGDMRFEVRVKDRIALGRRGILGHSRSGHHAVRQARSGGVYDSLFLLAPVHLGVPLADRPAAVVAAACDGDVPGQARRYMRDARRDASRRRPVFLIDLEGANHNYFNRTLSGLRRDDGRFAPARGCGRRQRLRPRPQQAWIDSAAAAFFDATLDGGPRPGWMQRRRAAPERLYGLSVALDRLFP